MTSCPLPELWTLGLRPGLGTGLFSRAQLQHCACTAHTHVARGLLEAPRGTVCAWEGFNCGCGCCESETAPMGTRGLSIMGRGSLPLV